MKTEDEISMDNFYELLNVNSILDAKKDKVTSKEVLCAL